VKRMTAKTNGGLKSHVYCAVKYRNCSTFLLLKHLGVHDGRSEYDLPSSCPEILSVVCASCDARSRYTREDVEIIVRDEPPPPDFVARF